MSHIDYKCLPFDAKQGRVEGYEIRCHFQDRYQKSPIKSVVFESAYDREAQMPVEIVVHWTRWIEYLKRTWPSGVRVVAVLLEDNTRWWAKEWMVRHDSESYEAAPILCRDTFKITGYDGSPTLLEVVGVEQWMHKRTPLIDPWERDNEIFRQAQEARRNLNPGGENGEAGAS